MPCFSFCVYYLNRSFKLLFMLKSWFLLNEKIKMSLNIIEKLKERNLKDRLRAKDQQAFEDLYNKNIDDIYRFIFLRLGKKMRLVIYLL